MSANLTTDVFNDEIAVSLTRAIAAANIRARELGIDVLHALITITQHFDKGITLWRINYGPKDYIGRRGGDLMIEVDPNDASIHQVLRGQ